MLATTRRMLMTINGKACGGATDSFFEVLNPFDGRVCGKAARCERSDLDAAVSAAKTAQGPWAARPWAERQATLKALAAKLMENKDALARLLTTEQGKGLPQAEGEILGSVQWLNQTAGLEDPSLTLSDTPKARVEQMYRPLGVVGCIVAWNFPLILIHFKIAGALLAGNTVVVKPSEHTPLTALELARLYNEVLPPGVMSVVTSDAPELGKWMVDHAGIAKISFTGSTATGKLVLKGAADTMKKTTMELGGNDSAIVLDDVEPRKVAPGIFKAAFGNSGQVCLAVKRVYVPEAKLDAMCDALKAVVSSVKFGNGLEDGVVFGPVNNAMQYSKVRELLVDALDNGAQIVHGEVPPPLAAPDSGAGPQGYLFQPVVLRNVTDDMRIVAEEQFGPVLPVLGYKTEEEAVARSNASEYGLGASVWGADVERAAKVAAKMDAGTTWVNNHGQIGPAVPFGGAKSSGVGHEGGREGLLAFMQMHVVSVKKNAKL